VECQKRERRRGGFTLIELLIVIAIIGVLAGLLLPALSRARIRAQVAKCMSNLHQIHIGMEMYRDDFDGVYPVDNGGGPNDLGILSGYDHSRTSPDDPLFSKTAYLGTLEVFHCPGTRDEYTIRIGENGVHYFWPNTPGNVAKGKPGGVSYMYDSHGDGLYQFKNPRRPEFYYYKAPPAHKSAGQFALIADDDDDGMTFYGQYHFRGPHPQIYDNHNNRVDDGSPGNVLFADGHVDFLKNVTSDAQHIPATSFRAVTAYMENWD